MHRLTLGLFLLLAACGPRATGSDAGFRPSTAPIFSNAAFDVNKIEGNWSQVAAFAAVPETGCRTGQAEFSRAATGIQAQFRLCLSGKVVVGKGAFVATGPGRFRVAGKAGLAQDWWVLWVDESYRTMAIGTPPGAFGFILNRGADLPQDRLAAAREVFDFNGYDTEKIVVFGK